MSKLGDAVFKWNYPAKTKWLNEMNDILVNQDANEDLIMILTRECVDANRFAGLAAGLILGVTTAATVLRIYNLCTKKKKKKNETKEEEGA